MNRENSVCFSPSSSALGKWEPAPGPSMLASTGVLEINGVCRSSVRVRSQGGQEDHLRGPIPTPSHTHTHPFRVLLSRKWGPGQFLGGTGSE